MIDQKKIGECIAQLRKSKGLTQAAMADMLNVSHQAVSKWENGVALPDLDVLLSMRELFGISIDELLCGQLPMGSPQSIPAELPDIQVGPDESREFTDTVRVRRCSIAGKAYFKGPFEAERLEVAGRAEFEERVECQVLAQAGQLIAHKSVTADRLSNAGSLAVQEELTADAIKNAGAMTCRKQACADSIENTGSFTIMGPATADSLSNQGAFTCHGALTCDSLGNRGSITAQAALTADDLDNLGSMNCHGDLTADTLRNAGSMTCHSSVSGDSVENRGMLKLGSDLECESLRNEGDLRVERDVNADKATLSGRFRIRGDMIGNQMRVTLSENDCCVHVLKADSLTVEAEARVGRVGTLTASRIVAKDAALSYVHCYEVKADKARIGDGCRIQRLECTEEPVISENSHVVEIVCPS